MIDVEKMQKNFAPIVEKIDEYLTQKRGFGLP